MRSGKGRHRRPRQAPALLVTAGVTGAGIATSLLGASGAQAVEASTWDKVAQCESGGAWSLNKANGYYGGLQLTLKTWEKYGGTEFAERPDLASRSQQIEVAERVLAAEGPGAWPACAVGGGLEEEFHGLPDLELPLPEPDEDDSKDDESDESRDDQGEGDESEDGDGAEGDEGGPGEQPDDAEESPAPPGDTSVPSPDVADDPDEPDDADATEDADGDRSGEEGAGDRDPAAGSGGGKHRGDPDPAERERGTGPDRPDRADRDGRGDRHLVRLGDTLTSIAERHELLGGWPALYERNERTVGDDPNLILPGQLLRLGADGGDDEAPGASRTR